LKKELIKYFVRAIILFCIIMLFSCTPVSKATAVSPENINVKKFTLPKADDSELKNAKMLINSKQYAEAEKLLVSRLNGFAGNIEFKKLLSILYFKTENYSASERFINSILKSNPNFFDFIGENIEFDSYYAFVTSLLRQNKTKSAGSYLSILADSELLTSDNRLKYDFLMLEYDYRQNQLDSIEYKIDRISKRNNISSDQKLNLMYIKAASQVKLNLIDSAMDSAILLILNDSGYKYTRKIKRLLDEIVDNSNDDQLSILKPKIADGYRELAARTTDNFSLNDRILRSLNSLENESVTVESKPEDENRSFISKVKLFADKDVTSIYITSKDSVYYSNPPLFDGKTLTMKLPGKNIQSQENFLKSPPGSGVESIQWSAASDTITFRINLVSNYDITIERSSGEEFEKSDKIKDKYSLKVNVFLPEQIPAAAADFDFDEERYTIVIDPGHGGDDPGALSILKKDDGTRYTEKEMNQLLSKRLKQYLEDNGYRVFLTREGDYYPSLHERNRIAQNRNADMFLSIHLNSASPKNKKYWQTERYIGAELIVRESLGKMPDFINFHSGNMSEWKKLREKALKQHKKLSEVLSKTIPAEAKSPYNAKRKIKSKNLVIFSGMTIPHALIEAGFIINNDNLKYLLSEKGQDAFNKGVLKGIEEYRKSTF